MQRHRCTSACVHIPHTHTQMYTTHITSSSCSLTRKQKPCLATHAKKKKRSPIHWVHQHAILQHSCHHIFYMTSYLNLLCFNKIQSSSQPGKCFYLYISTILKVCVCVCVCVKIFIHTLFHLCFECIIENKGQNILTTNIEQQVPFLSTNITMAWASWSEYISI